MPKKSKYYTAGIRPFRRKKQDIEQRGKRNTAGIGYTGGKKGGSNGHKTRLEGYNPNLEGVLFAVAPCGVISLSSFIRNRGRN